MTVTVDVEGDDVVVRLSGLDAVLALARSVRIPRAGVEDAEVLARRDVHSGPMLMVGGTYLPGVVRAGRFARPGWSEFWCAGTGSPLLVVSCARGMRYDRVVLEVPDPYGAADAIRH